MDGITSFVSRIVDTVNTFLWDYALLFLLVGAGIFFTPYAAVYPGAEIRGGNEIPVRKLFPSRERAPKKASVLSRP